MSLPVLILFLLGRRYSHPVGGVKLWTQ